MSEPRPPTAARSWRWPGRAPIRYPVARRAGYAIRRATPIAAPYLAVLALLAAGLGLRLLVWRWHEPYPLGGDESEYFNQALTLLREHRYVELKLMRPPLYTGFLALCIYLFDSLVQRLRLIQAVISALTILPMYALARQIFGDRRVALVAALLTAASYTLAANATELLTETLFLLGLTVLFWLLVKAGARPSERTPRPALYAVLAGLTLGALVLLRSVALPLLPLGALWLLVGQPPTTDHRPTTNDQRRPVDERPPTTDHRPPTHERRKTKEEGLRTKPDAQRAPGRMKARFHRSSFLVHRFDHLVTLSPCHRGRWPLVACFALACALVVLPWTIRNEMTYGAPILVDTTGPENLWLDNDPAGREAVKQQLYALGDDRATRQRIALGRGIAAITGDPGRFLAKAWGEAQAFFALQYFDDMRERRAIWVPPLEVWLRLLLGDGIWLALLLGGIAGLWLAPARDTERHWPALGDPRWLFVPWALYTLLTALVFHVELRYRLPLYPALIPYAAWTLTRLQATGYRLQWRHTDRSSRPVPYPLSPVPYAAALTCLLVVGVMLLHRPYIAETWMLAWKHTRLWQAERALVSHDTVAAQRAARAALSWDGDSALAQVALARAALEDGDQPAALHTLDAARAALPAHPYAHLLRGAILRAQGLQQAARTELGYETASLEDLQSWAWSAFEPVAPAPEAVDVGGGLDLGYIQGFAAPETGGVRWSGSESRVMLAAPGGPARLEVQLAPGRPAGAPRPTVTLLLDGRELRRIELADGWRTYNVLIDRPAGPLVLTLRSDTFRPRDYDPASPDGRALGVMVGRVAIVKL